MGLRASRVVCLRRDDMRADRGWRGASSCTQQEVAREEMAEHNGLTRRLGVVMDKQCVDNVIVDV